MPPNPPPKPIVTPTEQLAAVVTGWVIAEALIRCSVPPFPAVVLGLFVWCYMYGNYRNRWINITGHGRADPGA